MKKPLILTISFALTFLVSAQSDFRPGFIITNAGDSIAGEIDYRLNLKNYNSCLFKNSGGEVTEYFPDQLRGYGFLDDKNYTTEIEEGFFVEKLVEGSMSLYRFDNVFFVDKDSLYRFESKKGEIDEMSQEVTGEDSRWRGILTFLISDCLDNPGGRTRGLPFNEKNLTRLVINYNKCKGTSYREYKVNKAWGKTTLGITFGVAQSNINVTDNSQFNEFDFLSESYSSTNPFFGIVASFASPRLSDRLAFQAELQFTKSSYSGSLMLEKTSTDESHQTTIDLATLSFPISVRYSLPERKIGSLFFNGGLTFDFNTKRETTLNSESVFRLSSRVTTFPETSAFEVSKSQIGIWGGFGVLKSFNKFSGGLTLRYFQLTKDLDEPEQANRPDDLVVSNSRITFGIILLKK